ncbi:MAG: type II secretion system protein [Cyanobacteriota bacterium]|nr:type II secretion system protein [Cyanobacteriota bacterium]
MTKRLQPLKRRAAGFTLIEVAIVIVILGILGYGGLSAYNYSVKRARKAAVETQLKNAQKTMLSAAMDGSSIGEQNCLQIAGLESSNEFSFTCSERDDGSGTFDINALPNENHIQIGGVLSFQPKTHLGCVKGCDAEGAGESATLSTKHLAINNDCRSLERVETKRNCNCREETYSECRWIQTCRRSASSMVFIRPSCGPKKWTCSNKTRTACDTCTDVSYLQE